MSKRAELESAALAYHAHPRPGKTAIQLTKTCDRQADLALAYSPGVAEPVQRIQAQPEEAYHYTNKGNLVAVVTDGTAVLGLGDTGPLASKPVMEGKAVLFKRFAGIDAFDIEVDAPDADAFIEIVAGIAGGFGGINLEDIAAPHCFYIEQALQERLDIPVFHDDQHGTAVIIAAALMNALEVQCKQLQDVRLVAIGAGAAGVAAMELLVLLGLPREQLVMFDQHGPLHQGREDLVLRARELACATPGASLEEACRDADVIVGLSRGGLVTPDMLKAMAPSPVVFALANPEPEIRPERALATRADVVIATGRSDYPNQVNNVLGFPYIFRGALDVRASCINNEMKLAAASALQALAHEPLITPSFQVPAFGPAALIPLPFDPRLCERVSAAVAEAARVSGVARL